MAPTSLRIRASINPGGGCHVGPTKQHPKADVVVWLCPPCALELTDPGQHQRPDKAQPW